MRCKAKAKAHSTGEQCRKHARRGYAVCAVHGAGYSHRPGGRPVIHGRYSKRTAEALAQLSRRIQREAKEELDRQVTHTLFARLDYIGRALDVYFAVKESSADELEQIDASVDVLRELGKLSIALTYTSLGWMQADWRARLFLGNDDARNSSIAQPALDLLLDKQYYFDTLPVVVRLFRVGRWDDSISDKLEFQAFETELIIEQKHIALRLSGR